MPNELSNIALQVQQIDFQSIISSFSPYIIILISANAGNMIGEHYRLCKEYKPKNIKKVVLPPELTKEYREVDYERIVSSKFKEAVKKFTEVLTSNFALEDLALFFNNINELKIKTKNFNIVDLLCNKLIAGVYNVKNNSIIMDENYLSSIYHELFHMASSTTKDGIFYTGFKQSSFKIGFTNIGMGINEGYTELLSQRYFIEDSDPSPNYDYSVHIAKKLEILVGKEKMKKYYLNANLPGLINELKKYSSEKDISEFITGTDFLYNHLDNKKIGFIKKNLIEKSLRNVNSFLYKSYVKKLKIQLELGEITYEEFLEQVIEYVKTIGTSICIGKNKYTYLDENEVKNYISEVLKNPLVIVDEEDIDDDKSSTR